MYESRYHFSQKLLKLKKNDDQDIRFTGNSVQVYKFKKAFELFYPKMNGNAKYYANQI